MAGQSLMHGNGGAQPTFATFRFPLTTNARARRAEATDLGSATC